MKHRRKVTKEGLSFEEVRDGEREGGDLKFPIVLRLNVAPHFRAPPCLEACVRAWGERYLFIHTHVHTPIPRAQAQK